MCEMWHLEGIAISQERFFWHYLSKNDSSIEIIKQYFFCQIVAMNQKVIVLATLSSELSMTSLMDSPSPKTRAKRVGK